MIPARVSLTSNIIFNYDDDGDMHVLGAGARGVHGQEKERAKERRASEQRDK